MNRLFISFSTILFFFVSIIIGQEQESVSVTVYNNNLGVIKDNRYFDISSGISIIKMTDVKGRIAVDKFLKK